MNHEQAAKRKAAKLFGGIEYEEAGRGKVGKLQADGSFSANISLGLTDGRIWVTQDGERGSIPAIPTGVSVRGTIGFEVILRRNRVTRELHAFLDRQRVADSVGWDAANHLGQPDKVGDLDDSTVLSRRLKMGRGYAPAGDLVFRAAGFWYKDSAGNLKWWNDKIQDADHEADTSGDVPAGANDHCLVIVSLNPDATTPTLEKTVGSDVSISTTFAEDDLETLLAAVTAGYMPLFAVELVNGDTSVPEKQLWDVRDFVTSNTGAGSDTDAIHKSVDDEIHVITEKTVLADDDVFLIEDSAAGYAKKRVKKSNLPGAGAASFDIYTKVLLYDNTIAGAAGTWDVSSLAQTYDHLSIRALLRIDEAVATSYVLLSFNNDTTDANYRTAEGGSTGNDLRRIAFVPGASGLADSWSTIEIDIPFYRATTHKTARNVALYRSASTTQEIFNLGLFWENTAAINRISLIGDSARTFAIGSRIQIFGHGEVTVAIP